MTASLQALLAGTIDYAGLFPPAKLPLGQAFTNYLRYRREPEAEMLGRFVIPAARLVELSLFDQEMRAEPCQSSFALLGRGGENRQALLGGLETDLREMTAFRERYQEHVTADTLEIRLPGEIVDEASTDFLTEVVGRVEASGMRRCSLFVEPTARTPGLLTDSTIIDCLHGVGAAFQSVRSKINTAGFKLRCGGAETSAIPSPQRIAHVLRLCRARLIPLKLTAGLHHVLPRFDPALGATMHGFINILIAAVLTWSASPSEQMVASLIEDTDAQHFQFSDHGLRWQDWEADLPTIRAARQNLLVSFGSCSFDEPRAELHALGWL